MAVVFDASTANEGVAGASQTFSHTTGGGSDRVMVVLNWWNDTDDITNITYAGIALTQLGTNFNPTGNQKWNVWYLLGPTSGANNIIISQGSTFDGGPNTAVYTFTGGNVVNNLTTATDAASPFDLAITSAVDNLVAGMCRHRAGTTITLSSGANNLQIGNPDQKAATQTGAATATISWTAASGTTDMIGADIVAGTQAVVVNSIMLGGD